MGAILRRKFRAPVISRLTLAWAAFAAAALGVAALAVANRDAPKLALEIKGVEIFAPADNPLRTRSVMDQASAPAAALREDVADGVFGEDADDLLTAEDDGLLLQPDGAPFIEDVVITIDGAPVGGPRVIEVEPTALTARAQPIPDADPALLFKTPLGMRPRIARDGRRSAAVYARAFEGPADKPKVALIVGGLGLNPALTARAIDELPADVTLAFAPYAKDLEMWTARARADGHEIMIELPMEAHGGAPGALGPAVLATGRREEENLQRLDWLLSRFGAYFGATNYLGGKFSADRDAMEPILKRLNEAGVAYIDDTGAARRFAADGAVATVNRMVTPGPAGDDAAAAGSDLAALERIAKEGGAALGKAYAYEANLDAVLAWSRGLSERGIVLAPASALANGSGREP